MRVKRKLRAEHLRKGLALLLRWPGHLYPGKLSRHVGKDVFIREITTRLRKRHDLAPQCVKLANAKLTTEGLSGDLAAVSS